MLKSMHLTFMVRLPRFSVYVLIEQFVLRYVGLKSGNQYILSNF